MSISLPSELIISDVTITNLHRTYTSTSMSGVQYRRDSGVQYYKGTVTFTASGYDGAKVLNGFLAQLKGRLNSFELQLGGAFGNDDITVSPTLGAAVSIGADSINISNFSSGADVPMGSVFTLPNETKLYTILSDLTTVGDAAMEVVPAIKAAHSSGETINFVDPAITVLLDSSESIVYHTEGGLISYATVNWTELLGSSVVN